ncbi:uncharacterized protein PAC_19908 [Phialocephala subalpina]|uniref:Uncharacterized protein n=1 Tax=Phialocephala subalpina TaxID=576137 RepID=A0A1L7XYB0_9HELO|nr:uncharacterized protein PAC_19908 [Phialocephala subalpina]
MMWHDTRAQVLANLKFLYGPDVEVVILHVNTLHGRLHQAVAVNLHPFNKATWTKYLHGEPASSFNHATLTLLEESERELAKFFSVNGNTVPFEGDMAQILTLGRGQREDSNAGSSLQSDFVFIATPGSTLPDGTVPKELIEADYPVEEYPAPETPVAAEARPIEEEVCAVECAAEESALVEDCAVECATEESPAPEPEPVAEEDLGWGYFFPKKDKRKGKKSRQEFLDVIEEPTPEPELVPEPEPVIEDTWGTWGATNKRSKKKKGGFSFGSVDPVDEAPAPPFEPEPVVEDTWGTWGATTKKSRKKKGKELEVPSELVPEPEPGPVVDVDIWVIPTKKEEKMNSVPEPEPDEWAQFLLSKRSKNEKKEVPEMPLGEESSAAKEPSAEVLEVPPTLKSVEHSAVATSLPQATSTETTPHGVQSPAPQSGQTVVFTIQFPDEINTKPLQAMITLADNTRVAIFDAVHSYLDSKSSSTGRQGLRRLEIKSGAGKNGDVGLSMLEETMWPEYLEYFRQYTKLPELTVDCFYC